MRHRYFTYWRNTLRWGYRLSIKQLLAFVGYSVIAYSFLLGFWLALFQVVAFTPLMEYLTADRVINSSIWVTRVAQALVGIPVMLHAVKTVIWLFTTAPHGQCGDTRYYTDTSHHPGTNHDSSNSTSTQSHVSHHDSCSSDSGSGGDCDSSSSD
ncbi:hypothetical protein ACN1T9_000505 [Cronobacter sakazakii]|uniref:hypothetical protein n=1 Tax=Cronobacter sakazakii TaxID=28141 RepID=UPI000BEA4C7D|nr:hypothetical protein [Cronobacter sakazakii]EKK3975376.1 hypothetical protein [Cronobacter sakazakii]EKK4001403.1 hypothetical protein [Cronobacter sakazakii]EKK5243649.1 hypothetical protein [Cronobacter sakazakii]EKK7675359.1 hypothetical protein [Cronobacter sakazakii]EKY1981059.1 hypothetical protein [Cronobacter sakazakii]